MTKILKEGKMIVLTENLSFAQVIYSAIHLYRHSIYQPYFHIPEFFLQYLY